MENTKRTTILHHFSPTEISEYIIEDITWNENKTTDISEITNTPSIIIESTLAFDNFNKYQISTDPYFNTYGETSSNISVQEVYLYDTALNFVLHDDEPYITDSSTGGDVGISIQGIAEFYSAHLNSIKSNYTEFQTGKVSTLVTR